MSRWSWAVLLIAVTAIWGWTFTVMDQPIKDYGVVPFLTIRFALASILMSPTLLRRAGRSAARDGWWVGIILAVAYLLQTLGLAETSPTNCGLITGLFVIFTPLFNRLLFRVAIPKIILLAALLSLLGLVLLTGTGLEPLNRGDQLTFFAAAFFGLHIACLDRVARRHDAAALATMQFVVVAVLMGATWPLTNDYRWPSAEVRWALAITSVLATAVAFFVQTAAQQHLSASRVAVILVMEPAFAALFGGWLGGDRLTSWQWLGAAVMFGAVLLAEIVPRLAGEDVYGLKKAK